MRMTTIQSEERIQQLSVEYEKDIRGAVRGYLILGGKLIDVHRFVYEEVNTLDW